MKEFLDFIDALSKVEELTERDKLIMAHSYELGFRKGIEAAIKLREKE